MYMLPTDARRVTARLLRGGQDSIVDAESLTCMCRSMPPLSRMHQLALDGGVSSSPEPRLAHTEQNKILDDDVAVHVHQEVALDGGVSTNGTRTYT